MTTVAGMPRSAAASATPCAWFPALAAITPRGGSASEPSMFDAPRNLNEPPRCRCSHFSSTGTPARSESETLGHIGVTRAAPAMRSRAAWTSSMVTAPVVVLIHP